MWRVVIVMGFLAAVSGMALASESETSEPCWSRRQSMIEQADREPVVSNRIAILERLPDCDESQRPPVAHVRSGIYGDLGGGLGSSVTFQSSLQIAVSGGLGSFVTPSVALGARAVGLVSTNQTVGFLGYVGPMLLVWTSDQVVLGGGLGVGVAGCGADCTTRAGLGFDARVAFAPARDGRGLHVAVEAGHQRLDFSDVGAGTIGITTLLVDVGYASF